MAHVGQKLALGAAGALGCVPGLGHLLVDGPQLSDPAGNFLFQMLVVVPQLSITLRDVPEHMVETIHQQPDLRIAAVNVMHGIAGGWRHGAHVPRQRQDRSGNGTLQPVAQQESNPKRKEQYPESNDCVASEERVELGKVGFHEHRSQEFSIPIDPVGDAQRFAAKTAAFRRRAFRNTAGAGAGPEVSRKRLALAVVNSRANHVRFQPQRAQRLCNTFWVIERNCRRAVEPYDVGLQ